MKAASALVTGSSLLYGDVIETWFFAPEVANGAAPGQFVMAAAGDGIDPFLRRNHSIYRMRTTSLGVEFGLIYRPTDAGTLWLAGRREGDTVDVLGPLGRGFKISSASSNLLLIGDSLGVGPLLWLADNAISDGLNVTLALVGIETETGFPLHLLPSEIEIVYLDARNPNNRQGELPAGIPALLRWSDQIFLATNQTILSTVRSVMAAAGVHKPGQALIAAEIPCGFGICNGCPVPVRRGIRLACVDGPVFDLPEVA